MLFLNPQRSLKQEDIRSFLVSESDNRKFTEQMGQLLLQDCGKEHSDLSKTFQVMMKDSTGIPVNVHVFAVSYFSQGGLSAFKVGVLEVSDSDSMLLPNLGHLAEIRQLRRRGRRPKQDLERTPPGPPPGPPEDAEDSSGSSNGTRARMLQARRFSMISRGTPPPSGSTCSRLATTFCVCPTAFSIASAPARTRSF
ncbi:unnamed protein product [Prorocentrum cordatum]|uniref:Uncharacterized protein n=1 Tax=Prorocentrum cordatum TaxID=2364126 RepID=A0ABN9RM69_9DINO|nr:unnamed protein product [Polarella glacialis]